MATFYVRTYGNDGTANGSLSLPYATVAAAAESAGALDLIDVGPGTFTEVATINLKSTLKGAGADKTIIQATGNNHLIRINSGTVSRLVVYQCTLITPGNGNVFMVSTAAANATLYLARCLLRTVNGYAVYYSWTDPNSTLSVLNCVITGQSISGYVLTQGPVAFYCAVQGAVLAYNCIFTGLYLVVDDAANGRPVALNYNFYFNNLRTLRTGVFGLQDVRDQDPQFINLAGNNPAVLAASPVRDAGLDLTQGYGNPPLFPPFELNWGYTGSAPDIGVTEVVFPNAAVTAAVSNFNELLQVFAQEYDIDDKRNLHSKYGLFIDEADSLQLQRRFGTLMDVYRPSDMTQEQYRSFLKGVQKNNYYLAPASGASDSSVELLYASDPQRIEYFKERRFPLSSDLKLNAIYGVPLPPLVGWTPTQQNLVDSTRNWWSIYGFDDDTIWIGSDDGHFALYSGNTETYIPYPRAPDAVGVSGVAYIVRQIWGPNRNLVFFVGSSFVSGGGTQLIASVNGAAPARYGYSFPTFTNPTCIGQDNTGALYVGVNNGAGSQGVWKSTNSGVTYAHVDTSGDVYCAFTMADGHVLMGGASPSGGSGPLLLMAYNGSVTAVGTTGISGPVYAVWANSATDFYVATRPFANSPLYHTTDGGSTWVTESFTGGNLQEWQGAGIWGLPNTGLVYAFGNDGNNSFRHVCKLQSAGHSGGSPLAGTWIDDPNFPVWNAYETHSGWVSPLSQIGYFVGSANTIFQSQVRTGWDEQAIHIPGGTGPINSVYAPYRNNIYVATASTNWIGRYNGSSWSWSQIHNANRNIRCVWGFTPNKVWAVGATDIATQTQLYYTTDGGTTWTAPPAQPANGSNDCLCVHGISDTALWFGYTNGAIYYTPDGGNTFIQQVAPNADQIKSIYAVASNKVFACGTNGAVYYFDGATWTRMVVGNSGITWNDVSTDPGNTSIVRIGGNDPAVGAVISRCVAWPTWTADTISFSQFTDNQIYNIRVLNGVWWATMNYSTNFEYPQNMRMAKMDPGVSPNVWTLITNIPAPPYTPYGHTSALDVSRLDNVMVVADTDNKIWFYQLSGDPTKSLLLQLTGGPFQLSRRWYLNRTHNFTVPPNSDLLIYTDGSTTTDDITPAILQSTDQSIQHGYRVDTLTGTVTFAANSLKVVGSGTAFTTEAPRHTKIRPSGTVKFFVVDSVQDDTHLTLRYAYDGFDYVGAAQKQTPVKVFGEVITNATTIINIHSQGRLGDSAWLNTAETKGHGFHLIVDDPNNALNSIFANTERSLLEEVLQCQVKPAHKLGYISFRVDYPSGKIICYGGTRQPLVSIIITAEATLTINAALTKAFQATLTGLSRISAIPTVYSEGQINILAEATIVADAKMIRGMRTSLTGLAILNPYLEGGTAVNVYNSLWSQLHMNLLP